MEHWNLGDLQYRISSWLTTCRSYFLSASRGVVNNEHVANNGHVVHTFRQPFVAAQTHNENIIFADWCDKKDGWMSTATTLAPIASQTVRVLTTAGTKLVIIPRLSIWSHKKSNILWRGVVNNGHVVHTFCQPLGVSLITSMSLITGNVVNHEEIRYVYL